MYDKRDDFRFFLLISNISITLDLVCLSYSSYTIQKHIPVIKIFITR